MAIGVAVAVGPALPVGLGGIAQSAEAPADRPAENDRRDELIERLMRPEAEAKDRVQAIVELVALGSGAAAEARKRLGDRLDELDAVVRQPLPKSRNGARMAELRKTLTRLREDPKLSHEDLQNKGVPAHNELYALFAQWQLQTHQVVKQQTAAAAELDRLGEFFRLLRKEWPGQFSGPPPLPLDKFTTRAEHLFDTVTASEPVRDARILAQNGVVARGLDSQTIVGMQLLNRMRMECGSRPLLIDRKLCEAAHGHSKDMKEQGFFAHISPVPGKRTPFERAQLAGTTAFGENLYRGSNSGKIAVKSWFLSPGHHRAMLEPHFTRQGMGHDGTFWTAMFGGFDLQAKAWTAPARQVRPARPAQPAPAGQPPDGDEAPSPGSPDPDPDEE